MANDKLTTTGDDHARFAFEIVLFPGGVSGEGWTAAVWHYENGWPPESYSDGRWSPKTYPVVGYGPDPESALYDLPGEYRTHEQ
jgi:hypothetical protein